MDIKLIQERIAEIEAKAKIGSDSTAHEMEDKLYQSFVQWVASDWVAPVKVSAMAREILKTQELDFERWYQ